MGQDNHSSNDSTELEHDKIQIVGPEFFEFDEKFRFWFQVEFKNSFAGSRDQEQPNKRFTHTGINAYLLDPSDINDENESYGETILKQIVDNINDMISMVNLQMLLTLYWRMNLLDTRL